MKIKVIYGIEPILEITKETSGIEFGLHRDRQPDAGWGELRKTKMDGRITEVDLTPELRRILIEDICYSFKEKDAYNKLKEFNLLK